MKQFRQTSALAQLEWIVDVFGGSVAITEADVAARVTPRFLSQFAPPQWVQMVQAQAANLRPFEVTSIGVDDNRARAELATPRGKVVVSCAVAADERIDNLSITAPGGPGLTPRLPLRFTPREPPATTARASGPRLVVFAGVPATGKSTVAERVGESLGIPVFAFDWVLGALTPFGGRAFDQLVDIGEELLTTLAYRQLVLGQSAILDTPAENTETRLRWETMASHFDADFRVVVNTCSDETLHRERLSSRARGIPGWHEGGNWNQVRTRRDNYPHWENACVLQLDAIRPIDTNVADVVKFLAEA